MWWMESVFLVLGVLVVSKGAETNPESSTTEATASATTITSTEAAPSIDYYDEPEECDKKFICYYSSGAAGRQNEWAYTIERLNVSLCSHYIFAFVVLNGTTWGVSPSNPDIDIGMGYFKKFCDKVTAAGKIPLLSVGGWGDGQNGTYEEMFKDTKKQNKFIASVIKTMKTYGFEGLELDYEYPGCPMGECREPEAKNRFTDFVARIHEKFKNESSWTLSMAIPAGRKFLDYGFDLPTLEKYVDWFNVMGYDYVDVSANVTHLHSPKMPQPGLSKERCVDYTIKYIRNKGVSPESIVLGMPIYGKGYTLKDPEQHTINCPASGPLDPVAVPAFYEICKMQQEGWKMETHYKGKYYGRWMYKDEHWVGYDGIPELRRKTNMIKRQNLGGGMIWALDLDDFRGDCGRGSAPLTTFLSQQLLGNCRS